MFCENLKNRHRSVAKITNNDKLRSIAKIRKTTFKCPKNKMSARWCILGNEKRNPKKYIDMIAWVRYFYDMIAARSSLHFKNRQTDFLTCRRQYMDWNLSDLFKNTNLNWLVLTYSICFIKTLICLN